MIMIIRKLIKITLFLRIEAFFI